jgi:hypothetical protein
VRTHWSLPTAAGAITADGSLRLASLPAELLRYRRMLDALGVGRSEFARLRAAREVPGPVLRRGRLHYWDATQVRSAGERLR